MRWRLIALIAVPTAVGVWIGGLQIVDSIGRANEYQRVLEKAELGDSITELVHELSLERDRAVAFVAAGRRKGAEGELRSTFSPVDVAAGKFKQKAAAITGAHGESIRLLVQQMQGRLGEISFARDTVIKSQLPALPTMRKYSQIIDVLQKFHDEIGQGDVDETLSNSVRAFSALTRAKDAASQQRGLLAAAATVGRFQTGEQDAFVAARAQQESEVAAFKAIASIDELQFFEDTVTGADVDRAELFRLRALAQAASGSRLDLDPKVRTDADRWFESITGTIDGMRTVEKRLAQSINMQSRGLQDSARTSALFAAVGSGLLLILVLIVTTLMARSLVSPLRRLRSEALQIAGRRLPETVRTMRESTEVIEPEVPPIGVISGDEIGEVARAFDEVHREAVRLAGEESRLRSNVNAMFVNLSRRSQTLVERQITLIDGLEQGEQDESRLANLFKLDHLATRMRRNSENLLVLAGQDPPRRWSQPVKLVDVARASLSEVENYERVVLQVPDGVSVAGQAVNDAIHLLAELVENALSFSPRETRVTVSGSRIDGGGVMLSITDSGIGMTGEELTQANDRLTDAPTVDVSVSRRMGLFVVARLAHRHGIRVQLRPHGSGGLTAMVLLPEVLLGAQAAAFAGGPQQQGQPAPFGGPSAAGPMGAPPAAREDSFGAPPAAAQWGGSGHPSFPSAPVGGSGSPSGSWPSMPQWPSTDSAWPSEPRTPEPRTPEPRGLDPRGAEPRGVDPRGVDPRSADLRGQDSSDVWVPSRNSGGWNSGEPPLPRRQAAPPSEEVSTWSFGRGELNPRESRYDFPETEAAATGPIPAVNQGDEFLPIFASVESAWFDHNETGATWGSSKADAGWSAAEAVREPVRDKPTAAGLPKRVPKANLVPGSADTSSAPKGVAPMPAVSPDRVRSRLSSFQQGFRAARDDITEGRAYPPGSNHVENREEGE
ncbi:nitrate- and nitrite sensing domain-containing protein [Nonomuraea sp. NBC_01738]|uniref:sensor histidine kinase n=1 Tax=Nonomuraea sp. NBC_01738 TaxID=2976003 RepID=UPI002E0E74CC|nr:nitrate- and nitrite sensing domain-containing protein [Nonomuraea sp. NBC_01738]